jgi:hypothetical protein
MAYVWTPIDKPISSRRRLPRPGDKWHMDEVVILSTDYLSQIEAE